MRKFRIDEKKESIAFPMLTSNEFVFTELSLNSIEIEKDLKYLDRKEVIKILNTRAKQFSVTNDNNFLILFLENMTSYAHLIGIDNNIQLIIPILNRIVLFIKLEQ